MRYSYTPLTEPNTSYALIQIPNEDYHNTPVLFDGGTFKVGRDPQGETHFGMPLYRCFINIYNDDEGCDEYFEFQANFAEYEFRKMMYDQHEAERRAHSWRTMDMY